MGVFRYLGLARLRRHRSHHHEHQSRFRHAPPPFPRQALPWIKVPIPNIRVGALIGKGGENIRSLRQKFGDKIEIQCPPKTKGHKGRRVDTVNVLAKEPKVLEEAVNEVKAYESSS